VEEEEEEEEERAALLPLVDWADMVAGG